MASLSSTCNTTGLWLLFLLGVITRTFRPFGREGSWPAVEKRRARYPQTHLKYSSSTLPNGIECVRVEEPIVVSPASSPRQVQCCEATEYGRGRFARILKVVHALGLSMPLRPLFGRRFRRGRHPRLSVCRRINSYSFGSSTQRSISTPNQLPLPVPEGS